MTTTKETFAKSLSVFVDSIKRPKAQILREMGIPQTTYNNWVKKHNPSIPGCVHFKEIVTALNPPADLIDLWREVAKENEIRLFDNIYDSGIEQDSTSYTACETTAEYNAGEDKKPSKNMHIPITGTVKEIRVSNESAVIKELNFPHKKIGGKTYKALKVENDSLAPIAYRGQNIIISENETINNGDLVLVQLKNKTNLFKRYYKKSGETIELEGINPLSYKPTVKVTKKDINNTYKIAGIFF